MLPRKPRKKTPVPKKKPAPKKKKKPSKTQKKVAKVMKEFHSGKLRSSSGKKVTNPKQAAAIGYSEARRGKR